MQKTTLREPGRFELPISKTLSFWIFFSLAVALGLALRVHDIDLRLLHNDEGVNFHFIQQTRAKGYYPYSHENYHGPTHFYFTLLMTYLFGDGEFGVRSSAIISGMLLFFLLVPFRRLEGNSFVVLGAFFLALSSSLAFYARYSIHESFFLLTTAMAGFALYLWHRTRDAFWITFGFVGVGLLIATKETFIISLFCLFFAFLSMGDWRRVVADLLTQRRALFLGALIAVVLIIAFFTGGLRWSGGLREMFLAVPQWVGRNDSDVGHHKAFFYYLELIRLHEPYLYILPPYPLLQAVRLFVVPDWSLFFPFVLGIFVLLSGARELVLFRVFQDESDHASSLYIRSGLFFTLFLLIEQLPNAALLDTRWAIFLALVYFALLILFRTEKTRACFSKRGLSFGAYWIRVQLALAVALLLVAFFTNAAPGRLSLCMFVSLLLAAAWSFGQECLDYMRMPDSLFLRFFGTWAFTALIVYSLVKYKTAWLIINLTFPALILTAWLVVRAGRAARSNRVALVFSVNIALFFGYLACRVGLRYFGVSELAWELFFWGTLIVFVGVNVAFFHAIVQKECNVFSPPGNGEVVSLFGSWACAAAFLIIPAYYCIKYNFVQVSSDTNKYMYVHTSPGMMELAKDLDAYWKDNPEARALIAVKQYWPLPYYVRDYAGNVMYLHTSSFKQYENKYQVLIFDHTVKKDRPGWLKKYYRLSDVQETHTYFRLWNEIPDDS